MDKNTQLTRLFAKLPVPCVLLKLGTGEIIDANEAFRDVFVPSGTDCIGKTSLDLGMWGDPEVRQTLMNDLINKGVLSNVVTTLYNKHKIEHKFVINAVNVENEYYVATLLDISDLEEQKAQYQKLLNKYQNIISLTGTAYVILDDKFLIQECNDKMGEIIGCLPIEIIGERFPKIIDDSTPNEKHLRDKIAVKLNNLLLEPKSVISSVDIPLKCKDGTIVWMSLNAGAFGYNKIVCFMNDISGKKKVEHSKFITAEKNKDKIRQKLNKFQNEIRLLTHKPQNNTQKE